MQAPLRARPCSAAARRPGLDPSISRLGAAAAPATNRNPRQRRRSRQRAASSSGGADALAPSSTRVPATAAPAHPPLPATTQIVRLFYESGWPSAVLHGSVRGGAWRDYALNRVVSSGGRLLAADVDVGPANGTTSTTPLLEFVVTDPSRQHWDKPPEGEGNYVVGGPDGGGASSSTPNLSTLLLRRGALTAVPRPPQAPPALLLVSDLDGTMIGKDDAATSRLRGWWEREQVARGGVLCFSSGRSIGSVVALLERDKREVLAHPDVVVSAVGTRVFWHERATPAAGGGRAGFPTTSKAHSNGSDRSSSNSNSSGFVEDKAWASELEQGGWDAAAAREAAYAALARAGRDAMHFLPPEDQGPLKVSCGVRDDALPAVLETLSEGLSKHRGALEAAQVVVSGHGGWRYVDVVPQRAGKRAALEHVQRAGGFCVRTTVAAGDSGNDVDMLAAPTSLALVVGNAQPDAAAWAEEQQRREREEQGGGGGGGGGKGGDSENKDRLYRARAHEAAGILEGLEYWGLKEKEEEQV